MSPAGLGAVTGKTFEYASVVAPGPVIHVSSPFISGSVVSYGVSTPIALLKDLWAALSAKGLFCVRGRYPPARKFSE